MTNYSRSVLKSNGLHRPKIRLKKFGFSLKIVPANIVRKLPAQRCSKPLFIAFFNFSHKRPTFAFTSESGYTLGFRRKIAHKGLHGETGGVSNGGAISTLGAFCAVRKPCAARCQNGKLCRFWGLGRGCSQRTQRAFGTAIRMMRVAVPRRRGPAGLRDLFASAEVAACTPCAQCFPNVRDEGWYHYPQRALRAAETPDGRLSKGLICHFSRSGGLH